MKCLFISDLHLDPSRLELFEAFSRFLKRESRKNNSVFILGDLVEAWVGDDDDDPMVLELKSLLKTCSDDVRLFLMHGNRDFLIGEEFCSESGVTLLPDPTPLALGEDTFLLTHGDSYCTSDRDYMQMRTVLRSQTWQRDFLSKSLQERKQQALDLRRKSQAANANKPENITDIVENEAIAALEAWNCNGIIHGHTHRPGIHELKRNRKRYVLGAWERCAWIVRFDNHIQLECIALNS